MIPAAPERQLGFAACFALVVGSMIGAGVFLLPVSLAQFGWNAVAGWGISIAGALATAITLAGLARKLPHTGGPAGYVGAAFGPMAGFLIGWAFWVSVLVSQAALAAAAASYFSVFMPSLQASPTVSALAFIWLVTLVNLIGVVAAGRFQIVTVAMKLLPLLVVAIIMALLLAREGTAIVQPFPAEGLSLAAISTAGAITFFALLGFETVCGVSDRVIKPEVNVPRALVWGTLFVGAVYLIVCSGIVLMMSPGELAASHAPFKDFVQTHWATGPALLVAGFAVVSVVGAINGFVMLQGELPRSMAMRGMLPQWFHRTNGRGLPVNPMLLGSVIVSLLVISNTSGTLGGLFTAMALLTTSSALWFYLACAAAAFKFRTMMPAAVLSSLFAIWTLVGAGWVAGSLSFVMMAAGLPLYLRAKAESRKAVSGQSMFRSSGITSIGNPCGKTKR